MGKFTVPGLKIGIISDTHGNERICRQIWQSYFKDVQLIIHAGDILYHGPRNPITEGYNPAGLAEFLNASPIPLLVARGNCDADVDRLVLQYLLSPFLFMQFGNFRIMVEHGDGPGLEKHYMIDTSRKYGIHLFITGHTHKRMLERVENVVLLNPGSPTLPKGDGIPSVALLENGQVQIINISTGEILNNAEI
jgi:hypothetical protein